MKKILCYGDSNTFGFVPGSGKRYKKEERWSGILSELLPDYEIIEEGMNNRMGFLESLDSLEQSGGKYLPLLLQNHKDIDIFILALGTNDSQFLYNLDEKIAETGLEHLVNSIYSANSKTKIIIIPPVKIEKNILNGFFKIQFDLISVEKIRNIFPLYKKLADKYNCLYFDFNEYTKPSEIDGLHYTKEGHKIIAQNLAEFIRHSFA